MKKRLQKKGWSEKEIAHAESVLQHAAAHKHPHVRILESSLYWFVLAIGVLGTVIVSLLMIPVFLALPAPWNYALVAIFGLLLGSLIVLVVKDLRWLTGTHHLKASLFIAGLGLFSVIFAVQSSNMMKLEASLSGYADPVVSGVLFFISFVLPYALFLSIRRLR